MTDKPIKLPEGVGPTQAPAGIYEHWCEHPGCKNWGAWGFSSRYKGQHFFCTEHREEGEQYL